MSGRHTSTYKAPLRMLDTPESGTVHEYGSPVFKSLNPCTAKMVPCKENLKWVSPDVQLAKGKSDSSSKKPKQLSSRENRKKSDKRGPQAETSRKTGKPLQCDSVASSVNPSARPTYSKLDFVHEQSPRFSCSRKYDNKENIKPGEKFADTPSRPKSSRKLEKQDVVQRRCLGTSTRVNRL